LFFVQGTWLTYFTDHYYYYYYTFFFFFFISIHINPNSLRFPCDYFEQHQITYKVHTRHIYIYVHTSRLKLILLSLFSYVCLYRSFRIKKKLRRRRRQINETHWHYHYPLLFFGISGNKVKKNKLVNTTNI
jgi:hypothetical protein